MIDEDRSFDERAAYPPVLTFLLGGLAGASLALLLAPQSGRDTRQAVGRRVRGGVSAARDLKSRIGRRGEELRDRASRAMSDVAEEARSAVDSIEDAARSRAEAAEQALRTDRTGL